MPYLRKMDRLMWKMDKCGVPGGGIRHTSMHLWRRSWQGRRDDSRPEPCVSEPAAFMPRPSVSSTSTTSPLYYAPTTMPATSRSLTTAMMIPSWVSTTLTTTLAAVTAASTISSAVLNMSQDVTSAGLLTYLHRMQHSDAHKGKTYVPS